MSFIVDFFYEIKGKDRLYKNPDLTSAEKNYIGKKTIFKHQSHLRLDYNQTDYKIVSKILFLIQLNQLYDFKFIKTNPINTNFFDKWWKIKKIPEILDAKKIIKLDKNILSKIDVKNEYTLNYLENFK